MRVVVVDSRGKAFEVDRAWTAGVLGIWFDGDPWSEDFGQNSIVVLCSVKELLHLGGRVSLHDDELSDDDEFTDNNK